MRPIALLFRGDRVSTSSCAEISLMSEGQGRAGSGLVVTRFGCSEEEDGESVSEESVASSGVGCWRYAFILSGSWHIFAVKL